MTALLVVAFLSGCEAESASTPDGILGIWVTDAPTHQDRTFEVREDAVIFGTGKFSAPRFYLVTRVELHPDSAQWKACTLFYREYDGSIAEMRLQYQTIPSPRLRFQNRDESWYPSNPEESKDA